MKLTQHPVPAGYTLVTKKANWKPIHNAIFLTPCGWVKPLDFLVNHTHDGPIAVPSDESILDEAKRLTDFDREQDYGNTIISFTRIAAFWSTYLDHTVTPLDVAQLMSLLKISRSKASIKRDTFVDQAGYARCAAVIASLE